MTVDVNRTKLRINLVTPWEGGGGAGGTWYPNECTAVVPCLKIFNCLTIVPIPWILAGYGNSDMLVDGFEHTLTNYAEAI